MSSQDYANYFGVPGPDGAYWGVDMSWWQGQGDHNVTRGYWDDVKNWAHYAMIRTSYGRSGDDGNQYSHFQAAREVGYTGTKGCYHYVIPTSGVDGNFSNFINRSNDFVGETVFDMVDFEEAPNPGAGFINELRDRVEQHRQRPCLAYGGKGYFDGAGQLSVPVHLLHIAHYPSRHANAWQPTTDWNSWGAPLMPDQYGPAYPGVWQWSSTAHGYSLDLNVSTTPSVLGLGGVPPVITPPVVTPPNTGTGAPSGADVAYMQQWLNDRGFNCGAVDGAYGPNTAAGVASFQSTMNAVGFNAGPVDGIWGPMTTAAADAWVNAGQPPVAPVQPPTPPPPPPPSSGAPPWPGVYLSNPTSGGGTAQWQQQMANRGWTIDVDDQYGPQSESVCTQFQAEKGLGVDGIVGPITWDAAWSAPVT